MTGASSGLGRAAAIEFARAGAHLVLAARRAEGLEQTAQACRDVGGAATAIVTDVTREQDVQDLCAGALAVTGSTDVWVNNAGVTCFGALEATPLEQHRRVIETNVFGAINGARAVIPVFRKQGRGVLINVGSILSKVGQPFVPSYVISKFALRGLSEALRAELAHERGIDVCTLLPYAMDTPHFQASSNFVGRRPHPLPPVQSPEKVAQALVDLANRPRREVHLPRVALLGLALHAVFPRAAEQLLYDVLERWHLGRPEPERASGNLWRPNDPALTVHGDHQQRLSTAQLALWVLRWLVARPRRAPTEA